MKRLLSVISNTLFGAAAGAVGLVMLIYLGGQAGITNIPRAFIILSGSMEPAIKTGSIVVTMPADFYNIGDVISYAVDGDKKDIVTHRIAEINRDNTYYGNVKFQTKGDANKSIDTIITDRKNVIGRVILTVPYLGYISDFMKRPQGFIFLVIVPATIIIYEELKSMGKELVKFIQKLKMKNKQHEYQDNPNQNRFSTNIFLIVPIIAAGLLIAVGSKSFFNDREQSNANVFGAATVFATPTPTTAPEPTPTPTPIAPTPTPTTIPHIVINEVFINGGNTGSNWKDQWVEIYNQTQGSINISGWTITNSSGSVVLPTVSQIPANGYGVIVGKLRSNSIVIPPQAITIELVEGKIGPNGLAGAGDYISFINGTTVIDQMSYGSNTTVFPNPPAAPSSTTTLKRSPNGIDFDISSDWVTNSAPSIGVINP